MTDKLDGLPRQLAELLRKVKHWDADRQFAEYDQSALEVWEELDRGAYLLLSNLARVVEDIDPDVVAADWRDTELL